MDCILVCITYYYINSYCTLKFLQNLVKYGINVC